MKKNFVWILLIVLIVSVLSACSSQDIQENMTEELPKDDEPTAPTQPSLPPPVEDEPTPPLVDDTPPVDLDDTNDEDVVDEQAPKPVATSNTCLDSARGDVSVNGVVKRGAASFNDYCCGEHFKVDYYCKSGELKSNPDTHCPSGCQDDTCLLETCGNMYCYGAEFVTCPQDFDSSSELSITKIQYGDLAGELSSPYVSFMLDNQADEQLNLRDYYFVFYNLDNPESTSSLQRSFAYTIIGSNIVPAGEQALVTIRQRGLAMDDEFCGNRFRVGLAKQKMFARCTTAISIPTEIVAMNELTLTC